MAEAKALTQMDGALHAKKCSLHQSLAWYEKTLKLVHKKRRYFVKPATDKESGIFYVEDQCCIGFARDGDCTTTMIDVGLLATKKSGQTFVFALV